MSDDTRRVTVDTTTEIVGIDGVLWLLECIFGDKPLSQVRKELAELNAQPPLWLPEDEPGSQVENAGTKALESKTEPSEGNL